MFASGEYLPCTAIGKRLLAHELTHVIQQQGPKENYRHYTSGDDTILQRFIPSYSPVPLPEKRDTEIDAIVKKYEERINIYREYYAKPRYRKQEKYFGKAIVNVISEIKERLRDFQDKKWIDCVTDFLQKRWYIGVKGAPAFKAKYGEKALRRFKNMQSSNMWKKALKAAATAENNLDSFETNAKQKAAIKRFPLDIQAAFKELKGGDPVFDDDKEYATYLQTIAHDYIDLSDALVECGCGTEKDWAVLIDILTDESAEGFVSWIGDVLGFADEALENFITLTMKRAVKLSVDKKKRKLICPDID